MKRYRHSQEEKIAAATKYLNGECGLAAYKQSLKSYLSFLEEVKSTTDEQVTFDSFNRTNVQEFIQWLSDREYSAKTINLKLTS